MTVIPECFCRGSSLIKGRHNGFPLEPCGNDGFFSFCKRLSRVHPFDFFFAVMPDRDITQEEFRG